MLKRNPPIPKSIAPTPWILILGSLLGKHGKSTVKMARAVNVLSITWKQEMPGMYSDSRLTFKNFPDRHSDIPNSLAIIFYRSALPHRCLRRTNVDKMVKMVTRGTIKKAKSTENQVLQVSEEKDKCCEKMIRIPLPRMRRVGKPKPSMISSMLVSIVVTDKSFLHLLLRTFLLLPAFKMFCPPESLQFWILMSLMCHGCPVLNVCSAPGEKPPVLAT